MSDSESGSGGSSIDESDIEYNSDGVPMQEKVIKITTLQPGGDCGRLLDQLMAHKWAYPFNQPVKWKKGGPLADYPRCVKQPRDLGTIKQWLKEGYYQDKQSFAKDVRLVWTGALAYHWNHRDEDIHKMAHKLSEIFEDKMKDLMKTEPEARYVTHKFPVPQSIKSKRKKGRGSPKNSSSSLHHDIGGIPVAPPQIPHIVSHVIPIPQPPHIGYVPTPSSASTLISAAQIPMQIPHAPQTHPPPPQPIQTQQQSSSSTASAVQNLINSPPMLQKPQNDISPSGAPKKRSRPYVEERGSHINEKTGDTEIMKKRAMMTPSGTQIATPVNAVPAPPDLPTMNTATAMSTVTSAMTAAAVSGGRQQQQIVQPLRAQTQQQALKRVIPTNTQNTSDPTILQESMYSRLF